MMSKAPKHPQQSAVPGKRRRLRAAISSGLALAALAGVQFAALPVDAAHAAGANDQHAYVAFVTDSSGTHDYVRPEAERLAVVDRALERWQTDSAGAISSFTRAGSVANITVDCTATGIPDAAWAQSGQAFPGVNFATSTASRNHFLVVAPPDCGSGSGYNGNRAVGLNAGGKVFVVDEPSYGIHSILHELGHNFSLTHAYSDYCNTSAGCGPKNYENRYEVMGYTLANFTPGSIGSYTRDWLGITQQCEAPEVGIAAGQRTATATYDLLGRGQQSGTRGLKITAADGKVYFVDFRNHTGLDSEAFYGSDTSAFGVYGKGVTINTAATVNGSVVPSLQTRPKNPANPTGGYYGYFEPGAPFTANGVQVNVDSMSASETADATAQVTVTLTNPDGTSDAPLPTQQGNVTVSGTPAVGATLTAGPADWTVGSCYRYQWFDNGVAIDGARAASYTPTNSQDGHTITVIVTGQQTGYQPLEVTSDALLIGGDKTAPTTTIDTKPAPGSTNTTPTFTFSASETATFECSIDDAAYIACESPFTTSKLTRGAHTFSVRATDTAGNTDPSPARTDFTIATPTLRITIGDQTVRQGEEQTATGFGFESGEEVSGVMTSAPLDLGSQIANADGEVTFTWTVPTSTDAGAHAVTLTGAVSGSVAAPFEVTAAPVVTPPGGGTTPPPADGAGGTSGDGDEPTVSAPVNGSYAGTSGSLAFTGADVASASISAVLLLAGGLVGLAVARRRRFHLAADQQD